MGASLQVVGFNDKIKTVEQARKDFADRQEDDRYENGHSYSGGIGMLGRLNYIGTVFNTEDDFHEFLLEKSKGDGYLAQVKVIRETKPLLNARAKMNALWTAVGHAGRAGGTPAVIKRCTTQHTKAQAKYNALIIQQAMKSTKTRFIAGGWCSS